MPAKSGHPTALQRIAALESVVEGLVIAEEAREAEERRRTEQILAAIRAAKPRRPWWRRVLAWPTRPPA